MAGFGQGFAEGFGSSFSDAMKMAVQYRLNKAEQEASLAKEERQNAIAKEQFERRMALEEKEYTLKSGEAEARKAFRDSLSKGGETAIPKGFMVDPNFILGASDKPFIPDPAADVERALEKKKAEKLVMGAGADVSGRITLAKESLQNIADMKKTLFPKGTAKSYQRMKALQGNVPMADLPLVPDYIPTKAGQDIFRKFGASLAGRQLIQTGVAARPEETRKLLQQFGPTLFSNPESTLKGLNELEQFYRTFLENADPATRFSGVQEFEVNGKRYRIPANKVDEFKKAQGL